MTTAEDRSLTDGSRPGAGRGGLRHWSRGGLAPVTPQMAAVILGCAAAFNLLGNLGFHTLVARKSSVGSYGVTTLFLSFGVLAGVLSSGFQYAAARHVVHGGTTVQAELAKLVPWLVAVVPVGALLVLYPPIGNFVHVNNQVDILLAMVYLVVTVGQAVPFGVLNGGRHFRTLGLCVLWGVSVRLVLFPLLASGEQTTTTALVASVVSTGSAGVLALLVALRFQAAQSDRSEDLVATAQGDRGPSMAAGTAQSADRPAGGEPRWPQGPETLEPVMLEAGEPVLAIEPTGALTGSGLAESPQPGDGAGGDLVKPGGDRFGARGRRALADATEGMVGAGLGAGLWGTWILALVFARHYLSATPAGIFSVAQVAAGAILFMAAPIVTAYVPTIARSDHSTRPVLVGLGMTLGISLAAVVGLVLFGRPVISLLYGPAYKPPTELLAALGLSASVVAAITFLLWSTRSQKVRLILHRRAFYVAVPVSFAIEIAFGLLWNQGMVSLALGPGVAAAVGLACGTLVDRSLGTKTETPGLPPVDPGPPGDS